MTAPELDDLIHRARRGELARPEQVLLSIELSNYREMALRMERAIHELVKKIEAIDEA